MEINYHENDKMLRALCIVRFCVVLAVLFGDAIAAFTVTFPVFFFGSFEMAEGIAARYKCFIP